MLQNLSKREWFNSKLRKNFLVFDKNQFPKFMDTSYDPTIFAVINAAYILKDKLDDFFKVVEPLIVFDKNKNTFKKCRRSFQKRSRMVGNNCKKSVFCFRQTRIILCAHEKNFGNGKSLRLLLQE